MLNIPTAAEQAKLQQDNLKYIHSDDLAMYIYNSYIKNSKYRTIDINTEDIVKYIKSSGYECFCVYKLQDTFIELGYKFEYKAARSIGSHYNKITISW